MRDKFIKDIEDTYKEGIEIIRKKNADYAKDADPFKNFKLSEIFDVSVERGILIRISDKIARISNLLDKEAEVKDERIEDTILDAINYLAILRAWLRR